MTNAWWVVAAWLVAVPVQAEVYKWVDENGKVQFGDRPPASQPAEDISKSVEKTNIDHASKDLAGAAYSATSEKTADEEALEARRKEQLREKIGSECTRLKEGIKVISSGERVSFTDENGKEVQVLEKDRGKKLEEWKARYQAIGCKQLETGA